MEPHFSMTHAHAVEAPVVLQHDDVLRYNQQGEVSAMTIRGGGFSLDNNGTYQLDILSPMVVINGLSSTTLSQLSLVCDKNSNFITMLDATKVEFLSKLVYCGPQTKSLIVSSSLSPSWPYQQTGFIMDSEEQIQRKAHQNDDESQQPQQQTIKTVAHVSTSSIMPLPILLFSLFTNCHILTELTLDFYMQQHSVSCTKVLVLVDEDEPIHMLIFALKALSLLEIVRFKCYQENASKGFGVKSDNKNDNNKENMTCTDCLRSPLDNLVKDAIIHLPKIRIFEHSYHGKSNRQSCRCTPEKIRLSTLLSLMDVPSLEVLKYTNLGVAIDLNTMELTFPTDSAAPTPRLTQPSHLKELILSGNCLSHYDATALAQKLPELMSLQLLALNENPELDQDSKTTILNAAKKLQEKKHVAVMMESTSTGESTYSSLSVRLDKKKLDMQNRELASPTTTLLPLSSNFLPITHDEPHAGDMMDVDDYYK